MLIWIGSLTFELIGLLSMFTTYNNTEHTIRVIRIGCVFSSLLRHLSFCGPGLNKGAMIAD